MKTAATGQPGLEIHHEFTKRGLPPRLTLFTTVPNLHFCIFFQFSIQTLAFACIHNEFVEASISLPSINKLCKYSANKSKKKAEKSKAITFLRSLCSGNFLKDLLLLLTEIWSSWKERKRFAADGRHFPPLFIDSSSSFASSLEGNVTLEAAFKTKSRKKFYRSPKNTRRCAINRSRKATPFSKLWDCVIWSGEVAKILPRIDLIIAKHWHARFMTAAAENSRRAALFRWLWTSGDRKVSSRRCINKRGQNEFIESWFSFSWTFSRTTRWTLSPGTAAACDCLDICLFWILF